MVEQVNLNTCDMCVMCDMCDICDMCVICDICDMCDMCEQGGDQEPGESRHQGRPHHAEAAGAGQ